MARSILVREVISQDSLLRVYHDYAEHGTSALRDVYLEAMVSLGSEIFIHWMVLPALSCWKDPWPYCFCISWDSVNLFGLPSVSFCLIPTWSDGTVLVVSLDTQIVIYSKVISVLPASLTIQHIPLLAWLGDQKVAAYSFVLLVLRAVVKDHKITVIGTSPWLASAAFCLAVLSQFI